MSLCKKYNFIFNEIFNIIDSRDGIIIYQKYLKLFNNKYYLSEFEKNIKKKWKKIYLTIKSLKKNINLIIKSKNIKKNKIYYTLIFVYNSLKKINNCKTLTIEIKNIINYPYIYDFIYYLFYILSNLLRCQYMVYNKKERINDKKELNNFLKINSNDFSFIKEYLTNISEGYKNSWGYPEYSSACSMYYTLLYLDNYYKDPLKKLKINFIYKKKNKDKKIILKNILEELKFNKNINLKVSNYNELIINLKKMNYNMWFVIELLFKNIFINYEIKNIPNVKINFMRNVGNQNENNKLGLKCYLLLKNNYITNTNLFKNFRV